MRLFIDTNILISTILFPSSISAAFVRNAVEEHTLVISDHVVEELYEVVGRKFPNKTEAIEVFLRQFPHERVTDADESAADDVDDLRDEKDRPIIAAAISSRCDRMITGDQDLLVSNREQLRIVSPGEFFRSSNDAAQAEQTGNKKDD